MDKKSCAGVIIVLLILLTGCKTTYVPVETIRTEYRDKYIRDSIYLQDSIIIRETGDTVFQREVRYIYKDRVRVDSIFIQDTIPVIVEVIKEKEVNKLTWWQETRLKISNILIAITALFLLFKFLLPKKI